MLEDNTVMWAYADLDQIFFVLKEGAVVHIRVLRPESDND